MISARVAGVLAGSVGAGAVGAAAAAFGAGWWRFARRPLPKTSGRISIDVLGGPVTVHRDRWGVPHIEADRRDDLWTAFGFVHAQDRFWQIDFYRRVASGRLSEFAGPEGLETDRMMLTLGLRRVAERELETLDPHVRETVERFCAGVNAGVRESRTLPLEHRIAHIDFEPYTPVDVLTIGKLLAFGLSTNWERELLRSDMVRHLGPEVTARLEPNYPAANPVVDQTAWSGSASLTLAKIEQVRSQLGFSAEAPGSNNWAVSPGRSATGSSLIAGDPHLPPSMPGIWYQASLRSGDRFARGASMAGLPGIFMGQNNDVCWTFTNVMADVQDLFVERVDGERYLYQDRWLPMSEHEYSIKVRGREQPEHFAVRETHHGPIVNACVGADEAEPLALRWMTLDEPTTHRAMIDVLDARSGPQLVELMSHHTTPVSNMVWADRHGSIGYKLVGSLPTRKGTSPDLPRIGWTGENEWTGKIPYPELPQVTDPESGYVITANNRVVGDDYPHHITSEWLDGYRARRIEQMITETEHHDLESFREMQLDVLSLPGQEVARRLSALSHVCRDQREQAAVERLRSWDGRLDPDSPAASIYQAFILRLGREFIACVTADPDIRERWLDRSDAAFTAHVTSPWRWQSRLMELWDEGDEELIGRPWDELALDSLQGAVLDLEQKFGSDPEAWRWGAIHALEFPHPFGDANPLFRRLFNRTIEVGGAQESVCQVAYDPNDPYRAVWAPSWRLVADPKQPNRSRWQMFTGQSGHIASSHYDDLQERWASGETQPMEGEGPWKELRLEPA